MVHSGSKMVVFSVKSVLLRKLFVHTLRKNNTKPTLFRNIKRYRTDGLTTLIIRAQPNDVIFILTGYNWILRRIRAWFTTSKPTHTHRLTVRSMRILRCVFVCSGKICFTVAAAFRSLCSTGSSNRVREDTRKRNCLGYRKYSSLYLNNLWNFGSPEAPNLLNWRDATEYNIGSAITVHHRRTKRRYRNKLMYIAVRTARCRENSVFPIRCTHDDFGRLWFQQGRAESYSACICVYSKCRNVYTRFSTVVFCFVSGILFEL